MVFDADFPRGRLVLLKVTEIEVDRILAALSTLRQEVGDSKVEALTGLSSTVRSGIERELVNRWQYSSTGPPGPGRRAVRDGDFAGLEMTRLGLTSGDSARLFQIEMAEPRARQLICALRLTVSRTEAGELQTLTGVEPHEFLELCVL